MADGREDFIIDDDNKRTFPSLSFFTARLIYYINVNCMYNIRKAQINPFCCRCDDYSGCPLSNGIRDYCDVCSLFCKHDVEDYEKDFCIKNLINKNIELMNDFKKYNVDIDNSDYQFKFNKEGIVVSFKEIVFCNKVGITYNIFY